MFLDNILNDINNIISLTKINKNYTRIFFFENEFIENHLSPYIYKNKIKKKSLIVSIYKINKKNLGNFDIINFNYLFFIQIFFYLLKVKYIYSSTPDLNFTAFKKSLVKKNKYIYIQHSPASLTMIYNKTAFINFDIVFTVNKFQVDDITELNNIYNLKIKKWKSSYLFLNKVQKKTYVEKKKILIAPTWGTKFFDLDCHLKLSQILKYGKYDFELRPHFMSFKKKEVIYENLKKNFVLCEGRVNFANYHTIITDWSGIFIEFSKLSLSKCILLRTKKKILNKDFNLINSMPIEIYSRKILGYEIDIEDINKVNHFIDKIISNKSFDKIEIEKFFKKNFF